jgi:hypothetical protein
MAALCSPLVGIGPFLSEWRHRDGFVPFRRRVRAARSPAHDRIEGHVNVNVRIATLVATAMLGMTPAVAGASPQPSALPVLWQGQVVTADGSPTAAKVSAVAHTGDRPY